MLKDEHQQTLSVLIKESLDSDEPFCLSVSSSSMSPLINPEDQVAVRRGSVDTMHFGDIVVFERQHEFYVHRIIGVENSNAKKRLITKGDAALLIDTPVCAHELIGKVVSIQRAGAVIHLERTFWKIINGLLGAISYLQWHVFRLLRGWKRSIFNISKGQ